MLKDIAGIELPPPARKAIDIEGRTVKDGLRKTVKDYQTALDGLVKAIREFRKFTDQPLTLRVPITLMRSRISIRRLIERRSFCNDAQRNAPL